MDAGHAPPPITAAIYALHAFQKKSTRGIATPARNVDLIRRRLADAERLHRQRTH